ncbi:MAG: hypothetical protein QXJ02_06880 [Candidatus Bathyarchaeia archaeon]
MQRSLSVWKESENRSLDEDEADYKCSECGEEFHRPIFARNTSGGQTQTYYACPHCLTEVAQRASQRSEKSRESSDSLKEIRVPSVKLEEKTDCRHFLGFLKKRPKDMAIPEECLVCERMIECMVH